MKYISKRGAPHAYMMWCRSVSGTQKEHYGELPAKTKAILLRALMTEQGGLCAYTLKRIGMDDSHVEHIKPESLCRDEKRGTDLDYNNMVACFPREGMQRRYRYGAQLKGSWWVPERFISPLHPKCEQAFFFDEDGSVRPAPGNGVARETIKVLGLDHGSLAEDRRRVIEEFLYGPDGQHPLSPAKAEQAQASICNMDSSGRFHEFCIPILHALRTHRQKLIRAARKRDFAKKQDRARKRRYSR